MKCKKCDTCASFGIAGSRKRIYCLFHKEPEMINLSQKICRDCDTCASFGNPETKIPLYCKRHKLEGMVNVVNPHCLECSRPPNFCLPGETKPKYCSDHKTETMINIGQIKRREMKMLETEFMKKQSKKVGYFKFMSFT